MQPLQEDKQTLGRSKLIGKEVSLKRLKIHFQNRKSPFADAYYDAELKVNQVFIDQAKAVGNVNQLMQAQIQRAQIIYQKHLSNDSGDLEKVALKVRELQLATQELKVANLLKVAKDEIVQAISWLMQSN